MNRADLLLVGLVAGLVVVLTMGARSAATRGGLSPAPATLAGVVAVAWLGVTAALASSGVLTEWTARPPRVGWLPLIAMALLMSASMTPHARRIVVATPASWPLLLQSFRVVVELGLFWLLLDGRAPVQVTFEGRNFDIVAGLTAPVIAAVVSRHGLRTWSIPTVLTWNVIGLALLGNTMFTAATSIPGPMQIAWPGGSFEALASWPVVWIPAFLAPMAVFLHAISIRQVLAARRRGIEERRAESDPVTHVTERAGFIGGRGNSG